MIEQYSAYRLAKTDIVDLVVVLSGGLYLELETVLVAPLFPVVGVPSYPVIHPVFDDLDVPRLMKTELIASLPTRALATRVGTLRHRQYDIQKALDRLIGGY